MNRAERRRLAKNNASEPVINIKSSDIERIKAQASEEAVELAFTLMLGIPAMVIHDKFGQLMKKDGREERFVDMCMDLYDSYDKGFITLEDLHQCLWEEANIKIERRKKK